MTVIIDTLWPQPLKRVSQGAAPAPRPHGYQPLYQPRIPIHPKLVHGRYRALKWGLMVVTLAIYYGAPWIRWPRPGAAPQQAILIDFSNGRFYFGPIHLWPQPLKRVSHSISPGSRSIPSWSTAGIGP